MNINFVLNKKKLLKYLTSLYGIGKKRAVRFHKLIGINLRLSSYYILKYQKKSLAVKLVRLVILEKLRKYLSKIHRFAYNIRLRKGIRNKIGLPSRGQQTRTNAKTKKKIRSL